MKKFKEIVNKKLLNYITDLGLHDNIYDLYATSVFVHYLLNSSDEFQLCSDAMKELFSAYGYEKNTKTLFETLIAVKKDYSTESNQCRVYEINPKYYFKLAMLLYDNEEVVSVKREGYDVPVLEYEGQTYESINQIIKEYGRTKYMINKDVVKKTIKRLLYVTKDYDFIDDFSYDYVHRLDVNFEDVSKLDVEIRAGKHQKLFMTGENSALAIARIAKGSFDGSCSYTEGKSGRLFFNHVNGGNLQNMRSIYRELVFHGQYEIDINTAAPTILYQMYRKMGGSKLIEVEDYIESKELFRRYMEEVYELEYSVGKQILNSLFFGAKISRYGKSAVELIGKEKVDQLINDESMLPLFEQVDKMFFYLLMKLKDKFSSKNIVINSIGKQYKVKNWSKDRAKIISHMYFGVERMILDVMKENTDHTLLLHDAVVCKTFPNLEDIISKIKAKTGYDVTLSFKKYDKENFYKELE